MLKSIVKISLFSSIGSLIMAMPVMSYSPFNDQAREMYNVRARCEMCHQGPQLNSFGKDFSVEWAKSHNIVTAYKAVENLDSDNDGFLNVDEIKAMSLPGDKTSVPFINKTGNNSKSYLSKSNFNSFNINKVILKKSH